MELMRFTDPAEFYRRNRNLLEEAEPGPGAPAVPKATGDVLPPEGQARRVKLRSLPMPPEVAQEVKKHCRQLGVWRRKYVREVENDLMLQYYFGGQDVYLLPTAEGPVIIPIPERQRETPDLRNGDDSACGRRSDGPRHRRVLLQCQVRP